jgi:hypothetical protein
MCPGKNIFTNKIKKSIQDICSLENTSIYTSFVDFITDCRVIGEYCKINLIDLFENYLIKDYINCMAIDGTYAGLFELKAIGDLYKTQIKVFELTNEQTQYKINNRYAKIVTIINPQQGNIINLLYDKPGAHYELLQIGGYGPTAPPAVNFEYEPVAGARETINNAIDPMQLILKDDDVIIRNELVNINDIPLTNIDILKQSNKNYKNISVGKIPSNDIPHNPMFNLRRETPKLIDDDIFLLDDSKKTIKKYCDFINSQ